MTSGVREPIAGGNYYAADPQRLRSDIDELLAAATVEMGAPKALIVPHGPYSQSGQTAAAAYGLLAAERGKIQRVILMAPSHDVALTGVSVPRNVAFRTPLGDVLIDRAVVDDLAEFEVVTISDRPHQREFSLEVQLPFLQRMIGQVQIVPMAIGEIGASALANLLESVWGGNETLVVLSADLSHGLDRASAVELDTKTAAAIIDLTVDDIDARRTCASHAMRGLVTLARRRGMVATALAQSTSGDQLDASGADDVAGAETVTVVDDAEVIGYGSFGFWESPLDPLDSDEVAHVLALAGAAAHLSILGGEVDGADVARVPKGLVRRRAAFVSAYVDGELRGSAGSLDAQASLAATVVRNASRAVNDERLGAVNISERAQVTIGVTVLGPLERIRPASRVELVSMLEIGVDGLLARHGNNRATFLPAVWASLSSAEIFVDNLLARAKIEPDVPLTEVVLHRYRGLHYGAS